MEYYTHNSYVYPKKVHMKERNIHHIVDYTPEKYKSVYVPKVIGHRESDAFYFMPTSNIPQAEIDYENQMTRSYIIPGDSKRGAIREIHSTVYSPQKFNEAGILREKRNYILYENKNWTENVKYPIVEYEKVETEEKVKKKPPPPPPAPKPPSPRVVKKKKEVKKEVIKEKVEIVNEEVERDEDKKKKYLKSNYIRKRDKLKNKKYNFKKINYDKNNYIRKSDNNYEDEENVISIYDSRSGSNINNYLTDENYDNNINDNDMDDEEIKRITKVMEKKKISDDFIDKLTTKKEYKFSKTSRIITPVKK